MSSSPHPGKEAGPHPALKAWRIRSPAPPEVRSSLAKAGCSPLLAQLLHHRGIFEPGQARAFLSSEPVCHDPLLLPGMEGAVQRLVQALDRKERIAVFGDFDVDGVTATALLARVFKSLGNQVLPYIPHRMEEGHGLSLLAVDTLAKWQVNLLITVDTGVTSRQEITAAAEIGIDTIVTDHHLAPEGPPPAIAVVDPQLPGSLYPFPHLTGAGLALKLAQALYRSLGRDDAAMQEQVMPLAALGTVADVAPMVDENRSIVRQGLKEMGRRPTAGLKALMRSARLEGRKVDTEAVAWVLAPRLNAAGRMDSASVSYQLLMEESEERAANLAAILEGQNRERQRLTSGALGKARGAIEMEPLLMASDSSFSPGIIGLVAGRLVEEFSRPAVVVSLGDEVSRGSCRSVPEFDIGRALHSAAARVGGFVRYGGHPQAAGFTIATERLPLLRRELVALAREALGERAFQPHLDIDLEMPLGSLPRDVYGTIQALAPFGSGNPAPVFLSRNVRVAEVRPLGAGGEHVRLKLKDRGVTWEAMAFGQGSGFPADASTLDVVYTIETDRWNGQGALRLNVLDARAGR